MTCDTAIYSGHWDWCMQTDLLQCSVYSNLYTYKHILYKLARLIAAAFQHHSFCCNFLKSQNARCHQANA